VLDASHPAMREHFAATNQVLEELQALDKPLVLAFNKCDVLPRDTVAMIRRRGDWSPYEEVVAISARTGDGLPSLLEAIERQARSNLVELTLLVPYDQAGVESDVREHGRVVRRDYLEDGIKIEAEVPGNLAGRFAAFVEPGAKARAD
jgi:GTP-binding protein HflX